ncbi:MAG: Coenzyme F420 hydrogenase/dehydrogenase, beta subunit C-terminal domain [Syntrophales bacterium]
MKLRNVQDVAKWRLCVGCGACAYMCPEKNVSLVNVAHEGIRPRVQKSHCKGCGECLTVCPGIDHSEVFNPQAPDLIPGLTASWGPVLDVWEGHAIAPEIREKGSSGGLASALSLYCIEEAGMQGVLHTGPREMQPIENSTAFSTNRSQILTRAGSRYSPASPCDGLGQIEAADRPCVFIGKPCDGAALKKAREMRSGLNRNVGVAIGIFCAGTPASQGTIDLFKKLGVHPDSVAEVRYRGHGWPGKFAVRPVDGDTFCEMATYMDAWGFLQKYRPYRCYLCPDGTSELADISCGDPWYRNPEEGELGSSLALARTEKGRIILRGAMEAGYVVLERRDPRILEKSQQNLSAKRSAIWGRLLVMKTFGIPTPRLRGFHLFESWRQLSEKEKARSILGTARRIIQRGYYKPANTSFSRRATDAIPSYVVQSET